MGLDPSDESRAYVQFLVPHSRQVSTTHLSYHVQDEDDVHFCQKLCSGYLLEAPCCGQAEMADVLERLEACSAELGITDVQLSLTSLEEVFLTIARKVRRVGRCPTRSCLQVSSAMAALDRGSDLHISCCGGTEPPP